MNDKGNIGTFYVGAQREFKSVSEVLFLAGKKNLKIVITDTLHKEDIKLYGAENVRIDGASFTSIESNLDNVTIEIKNSENIVISNLKLTAFSTGQESPGFPILIFNSKEIRIADCIIHDADGIGILAEVVDNLKIFNNLIYHNSEGVYLYKCNSSIVGNTIIANADTGVYTNISKINLEYNVIALGQKGLEINNTLNYSPDLHLNIEETIISKNLCFSNVVNYKGPFKDTDLYTQELKFRDIKNYDFRLKDKKFEGFGANFTTLQRAITKLYNIENSESPSKPLINTDIDLTFFFNFEREDLQKEYEEIIKNYTFKELEIKQFGGWNGGEPPKTDMLFIINAFDSIDTNIVKESVAKLAKNNIPYFIFLPSKSYQISVDKMNLPRMAEISELHEFLRQRYPNRILEYSTFEELKEEIYNKLAVNKSVIRLQELELKNIGCFDSLTIKLDDELSVLVGLNGTGKTTVLRSMALALTGIKHFSTEEKEKLAKKFLKIKGIDKNGLVEQEEGTITLRYSIDGNVLENEIRLTPDSESIRFETDSAFEALDGNYLRSLVVGFSQTRSLSTDFETGDASYRPGLQLPNVGDLRPLILNSKDERLKSFADWIATLDYNAAVSEKDGKTPKETEIVELVFNIISEIANKQIRYLRTKRQKSNDIWITTPESPNGIRLVMASQGYKDMIGWVGFFIERMAEAYPDSKDFKKEAAIVILDEIDSYLHPQWQARILRVMQDFFPNTQFIVTTHSPVILEGLERHQIAQLNILEDHSIEVEYNEVNIWAWQYGDILRRWYDLEVDMSEYTIDSLQARKQHLLKEGAEQEEIAAIEETIHRVKRHEAAEEELSELKKTLEKRQKELDGMIAKVKKKLEGN